MTYEWNGTELNSMRVSSFFINTEKKITVLIISRQQRHYIYIYIYCIYSIVAVVKERYNERGENRRKENKETRTIERIHYIYI